MAARRASDGLGILPVTGPDGWSGVVLAWDVLAGIPAFLLPPAERWEWVALWNGPTGEVRTARGTGGRSEVETLARILPPHDPKAALGIVIGRLGHPGGFDRTAAEGLPAGTWDRVLDALPSLHAETLASLASFSSDAGDYGRVLADGTGRLREMLALHPVLYPLMRGPIGDAYIRGGVPAAAEAIAALVEGPFAPAILRRLSGVVPHAEDEAGAIATLRVLGALPVDLCPDTAEGYAAASALGHACTMLPGRGSVSKEAATPARLVRRTIKALDLVPDRRPGFDVLTVRDLAGHADALVSELAADVVGPALMLAGSDADPATLAREALFGGLDLIGAAGVLSASHRARVDIERAMPAPVDIDRPWPVPFHRYEAPNGYAVVALSSLRQLRDEGDPGSGLGHCVGNRSYARSCAAGEALILSVRDRAGEAVATVELRPATGGTRTRQFVGRAGEAPPDEARAALSSFLGAVSLSETGLAFAPFPLDLSYDVSDPDEVARAEEAWAPLLGDRPRPWAAPAGPRP